MNGIGQAHEGADPLPSLTELELNLMADGTNREARAANQIRHAIHKAREARIEIESLEQNRTEWEKRALAAEVDRMKAMNALRTIDGLFMRRLRQYPVDTWQRIVLEYQERKGRIMAREFITLKYEHIAKPWIHAFGKTWIVCDFIGHIMPQDIGKRVYLVDGILQVENDEQKNKREDLIPSGGLPR